MSGQAYVAVQKAFVDEVVRAFAFLVSDFGLAGPEVGGVVLPVVSFVGKDVSYRVMLDSDDRAVLTKVEAKIGDKRLVAELDKVVPAAGLGVRNRVARSAHTLHNLRQTLKTQADYVSLLHPQIGPATVAELMRRAGAREWGARH